jgi:hypothetical protein
LTLTTFATLVRFEMFAATCECEAEAADTSVDTSVTAPVRPLTLATFATAVKPPTSETVKTTVPVLPATDKTGMSRPETTNAPCEVATVTFAPACTISEVTPPALNPFPLVTFTESPLKTDVDTPVAATTVTLMSLMGSPP